MKQEILHIALLQRELLHAKVDINLQAFAKQMGQLPSGVDVVVLPETFATGFITQGEIPAQAHGGPTVGWMLDRAQELRALVCGTLIVEDGGKLYNRFYFAYPDGDLKWYDKVHLFAYSGEDRHITPGVRRELFTFRGWTICPQVCYDLRFPEGARNLEGYDLLIYSASFPAARDHTWRTLLNARAIENQCYVAGVNRIGTDNQGISYRGCSQIIGPSGRILSNTISNAPGIALARCSYPELVKHREKYPFLRDARPVEF